MACEKGRCPVDCPARVRRGSERASERERERERERESEKKRAREPGGVDTGHAHGAWEDVGVRCAEVVWGP